MENEVIEAKYPINFRQVEALELGKYLKNRQSVVLIGAKRVGISNFLRFFLHHSDIKKNYIKDGKTHLFIPVDLNDLVEREIYPFWTLTLKRIVDAIAKSSLSEKIKKQIDTLFLDTIQSQDLFLTTDNVRKSITILIENNILPTIFFIRFDRIKDAVTHEFFSNLQGLKDAASHKIAYVFTSFRSLDYLSKEVFTKASLSVFSKNMYIKPAKKEDAKIILSTFKEKYKINLTENKEKLLLELIDGYVQYLQLTTICLNESKNNFKNKEELFNQLVKDERIALQSDELWESLEKEEQDVLLRIKREEKITDEDRNKGKYLWDTGFVFEKDSKIKIFSPLFDSYLGQRQVVKENLSVELSKKEHLLFTALKNKENVICEREEIIEAVWPEVKEFGISDWAIDRLVARLRAKLKAQKAPYEIQTVKTRGYKTVGLGNN